MEIGTWADWVSGTGSWIAVVVALGTTIQTGWQRKVDLADLAKERLEAEQERQQGLVHQITFKLSTLASEVRMTHNDLQRGPSTEQITSQQNLLDIIGSFNPNVGYSDTMVRDLSAEEQNLLMVLKEDDFLMDISEVIARHHSIRTGLLNYSAKREAIIPMMPAPEIMDGQIVSYFPNLQQQHALAPYVIPLGTLVSSMRQLSDINMGMAKDLCEKLAPMMKKHFPELLIKQLNFVE